MLYTPKKVLISESNSIKDLYLFSIILFELSIINFFILVIFYFILYPFSPIYVIKLFILLFYCFPNLIMLIISYYIFKIALVI